MATECCVTPSNWPCKKLNTVLSVAFGDEVLAGAGSSADHFAPSSVFELQKKFKGVSFDLLFR